MENGLVSVEMVELLKRVVDKSLGNAKDSILKAIQKKTPLFIEDMEEMEGAVVHLHVDINTNSEVDGNLIQVALREQGKVYIVQMFSNEEGIDVVIRIKESVLFFVKETFLVISANEFPVLGEIEVEFDKSRGEYQAPFMESLEAGLLLSESMEQLKSKVIDLYLDAKRFDDIKRIQDEGRLNKKDMEILKSH